MTPKTDSEAHPTRLSRRQFFILTAGGTAALSNSAFAQTAVDADSEPGSIWWAELLATDPVKARDFYSSVVGWKPKIVAYDDPGREPRPGEKEYVIFTADGRDTAGVIDIKDAGYAAGSPPMWLLYVQVANVDDAAAKAVSAGGKILDGPSSVPDVGRIAVLEDPEGARFGLIAPL